MPDVRSDRHAYLAMVAAELRLPDEVARDVLDEVGGHLDETVVHLLDEGLTADQAERESIARLGDPGELANGMRRARQTPRRLLAAVGYGAWAAVNGAFWGYLFGFAVAVMASMVAGIALWIATSLFQIGPTAWDTLTPMFPVVYVVLAAVIAGRRLPAAIAGRAVRRVTDIARPIAVIGGLGLVVIATFVVRVGLDPWTVLALAALPAGFTVGAWTSRERLRAGRVGISDRAVVNIVLAAAAMLVVVNFVAPRAVGQSASIGPVAWAAAADVLGEAWVGESYSWQRGMPFDYAITAEPPAALDRWRDLRVEVWQWIDDGELNGAVSKTLGAALTVPLTAIADGTWHAVISLPATKTPTSYATFATGIAPDGRRYVLTGASSTMPSEPWVGTVWEYVTTP